MPPRWFDVVGDTVVKKFNLGIADKTDDLPYRVKPDLAQIEKFLPGREIKDGLISLRYFPGGVQISEAPLEAIPSVARSDRLTPIDIWNESVRPEFGLS